MVPIKVGIEVPSNIIVLDLFYTIQELKQNPIDIEI